MAAATRARTISAAAAFVFAGALLYISLRGIDWREVGRTAVGASPGGLAFVMALASVALLLRAWRWRILLNAAGHVSPSTTFWAAAAGYFGNNFLPARAGELVRTMMVSSRSGLDTAYVLATALSERVADAIALVTIASVALLTLPVPPGWLSGAIRPFAALALAGAAGIAFLPMLAPYLPGTIARAPMPAALRPKLVSALDHALRGMRAFHDVRRLSAFVCLTVVIWTLDAFGVVAGAAALGLHVPLRVAFLLIAGLGLGSALPSTPGYVGIYQFVAVSVLTPFGFSRNDAIAYILVAQALGYAVMGVWGSIGLWRFRQDRST